ncbi:MAG TPA: hypothetical protein VEF06_03580 [Bryobacteraceae bacterium]|nr:hypothetical protein [Bryobacteraceae bacterium]
MPLRVAAIALLLFAPLCAQSMAELREALSTAAITFSYTAPGLAADESLDQRGRRGFLEVLKGKVPTLKNTDLKLPEEFTQHHVVSQWVLTSDATGFHETRTAPAIDGISAADVSAIRHAMSIGVSDSRRAALEDYEHAQLEGAITDFSPLLLLFAAPHQSDYEFRLADPDKIGEQPAIVLHYRQLAGTEGLTLFDQRTADREPVEGDIWLRESDLLPLRITLKSRKGLSKNYSIDTAATVDYTPSPYGLAPAAITERQYLNSKLLVENNLHYSNYHRIGNGLIP